MWGAIIAAIVAIAGTAINAGVQSNENDKNRAEAQNIANRNRADTLKQQTINNKFNRNELNMSEQSLKQNTKLTNAAIEQKNNEVNDYVNKSNQSFLTQSTNKLIGQQNTDDSFLYKRSLLNRIR